MATAELSMEFMDVWNTEEDVKPAILEEFVSCETDKECLICGSRPLEQLSLPSSELPGAPGNPQLNGDLWALFTLKTVLGYNQQQMEEMLKSVGISIRSWFAVCSQCGNLVEEAMTVYQKILRLQERFRGIQEEARKKLEWNGHSEGSNAEGGTEGILDLGRVIRRQLREGLEVTLEEHEEVQDEENEDEPMDDWSPVPEHEDESESDDDEEFQVKRKPARKRSKVKDQKGRPSKMRRKPKPKSETTTKVKKDRKNKRKIYTCPTCGITVRAKEKYNYHLIIHKYYENCEEINGKLKCKLCGDLLGGPLLLRRHTRTHHAVELGIPLYQCHLCPKVYHLSEMLNDHIAETHTKQGRFICEVCGYATNKKDTYNKHLFTHTKDKPVVCHLCGAPFKESRSLQIHLKNVHSENRKGKRDQYPCRYCLEKEGTSFENKSLLNRHLQEVHKDLYKFNCDQCSNCYLSLPSLQLHQKIKHSGEQEAECPYCGAKVASQVYLWGHYKSSCKKLPPGFRQK